MSRRLATPRRRRPPARRAGGRSRSGLRSGRSSSRGIVRARPDLAGRRTLAPGSLVPRSSRPRRDHRDPADQRGRGAGDGGGEGGDDRRRERKERERREEEEGGRGERRGTEGGVGRGGEGRGSGGGAGAREEGGRSATSRRPSRCGRARARAGACAWLAWVTMSRAAGRPATRPGPPRSAQRRALVAPRGSGSRWSVPSTTERARAPASRARIDVVAIVAAPVVFRGGRGPGGISSRSRRVSMIPKMRPPATLTTTRPARGDPGRGSVVRLRGERPGGGRLDGEGGAPPRTGRSDTGRWPGWKRV